MTTMNVDAVIARMSAIQSQMVALGLAPSAPSASPATDSGSSSFASALSDAQSSSGVSGSSAMTPAAASTGSGASGAAVVASAEKYLGVPYVFGGTTTSGLDCSGLVQKAYGDLGISLPRIAADQAKVGTAVPSLAQAKPGDILAFGDPAYHVAIYVGDNKMIAAPEPGENVKIQDVYQTPTSIRRVVGQQGVAGNDAANGVSTVSTGGSASPALAGVAAYTSIFTQNESKYSLPSGLLAAVAETESGGNAAAVSPAGAQGLMQLMPSTANGLGVNPWDPSQAVAGAAQLLSGYLTKYGSVPLALAAYNAGPGAVEQYGGVPPYTETQNYVRKITGLMAGASA